jgi:ankyrin repeat protein
LEWLKRWWNNLSDLYPLILPYYQSLISEIDVAKKDSEGNTLVHWAIRCYQTSDTLQALSIQGYSFHPSNDNYDTPMHLAASYNHVDAIL